MLHTCVAMFSHFIHILNIQYINEFKKNNVTKAVIFVWVCVGVCVFIHKFTMESDLLSVTLLRILLKFLRLKVRIVIFVEC